MSHNPGTPSGNVSITPGDTVDGRYLVTAILQSTGYNTFLAKNTEDQRICIIKTVNYNHKLVQASPKSLSLYESKLFQEIEILEKLRGSKHIAQSMPCGRGTVYNFKNQVKCSGVPYLAIEYIEGDNLEEASKRQRLSVWKNEHLIDFFVQLHEALQSLWLQGVVHKDLKPSNIMLEYRSDTEGSFTLRLIDFGISIDLQKNLIPLAVGAEGSEGWAAPEQMLGGPLDHRTDVFPLGLIGFFLLSRGKKFWQSKEHYINYINHQNPPSSPSHRIQKPGNRHQLPSGFDAWFARCVAVDADDRFLSPTQALEELLELLRTSLPATSPTPSLLPTPAIGGVYSLPPTPAPPPPTQRSSHLKIIAVLGVVSSVSLLLLCAGILWVFVSFDKDSVPLEAPLAEQAKPLFHLSGSSTIGTQLASELVKGWLMASGYERIQSESQNHHKQIFGYKNAQDNKTEGQWVMVSIDSTSSGEGVAQLALPHGPDIAMSSSGKRYDIPEAQITALGFEAIVVIAHQDNPLAARGTLTYRELTQLLCQHTGPQVSHANEIFFRTDHSGTSTAFHNVFLDAQDDCTLRGREMAWITKLHNNKEIVTKVSQRTDVLGITSYGVIANAPVKVINVVPDAHKGKGKFNRYAIMSGKYEIVRELMLFRKENAAPQVREFLAYARGDLGQRLVDQSGFVSHLIDTEKETTNCLQQ